MVAVFDLQFVIERDYKSYIGIYPRKVLTVETKTGQMLMKLDFKIKNLQLTL